MPLELDTRQRAMLLEMGVHVWLPAATPDMAQQEVAPATEKPTRPAPPPISAPRPAPPQAPPATTPTTPTTLDVHAMDWPELARAAASCQACGLCAGRKNSTLFAPETTKTTEASASVSTRQADWFILGDPPNAEEDRLGQPFVAEDGRLLDNMLKTVGISRHGSGAQGAYLSNIVKCRPPHGRAPQSSELNQCTMYLQREIDLLRPKVILVMGRRAAQTLLGASSAQAALPLDKQRGTVHHYHYRNTPLVITYPLQTLLRTSALKAGAWADVCLAADVVAGKAP